MPGLLVYLNPVDDPIQPPMDFVVMLREDLGDVSDDALGVRIETWLAAGDPDADKQPSAQCSFESSPADALELSTTARSIRPAKNSNSPPTRVGRVLDSPIATPVTP